MAADLDVEVVGREFVRQYYTLLNQRPDCLHQFFTQDSSFVHGGIEKPGEEQPASRGQTVIHQKILALNFRDCHTKIRQVDCQKTVGNAVLVQASGELSNNGDAMRRFMQTFVLVQQAPKKFYVHNDIFRYQDEVFHECEPVTEDQFTDDLKPEEESVPISSASEGHDIVSEDSKTESHDEDSDGNTYGNFEATRTEAPVLVNQTEVEPLPVASPEPEDNDRLETMEPNAEGITEKPIPAADIVLQLPSQKPFSWASLASKNAGPSGSAAVSAKPQAAIKPERKAEVATTPAPQPQRAPRPNRASTTINEVERRWTPDESEDSGKPNVLIPDNQQLFVGNLPHSASDSELQEMFEQFGTVVDIKINRKGVSRDLPNFGFIAFDSTEAVAKALKARPIMLHGKRRINIEEKKDQSELGPRARPASRGRGGGFGRGGGYAGRAGRGGSNRMSVEGEP